MTVPIVLLTLDEARDELGASAIALVDALDCSSARLARLLYARSTTKGLTLEARRVVQTHRTVVRRVLASDHAWILDDELEGALSYARWFSEPETEAQAA